MQDMDKMMKGQGTLGTSTSRANNQREVPAAFERLTDAITRLEKASENITPVVNPNNVGDHEGNPVPFECAVASALRNATDRVTQVAIFLEKAEV